MAAVILLLSPLDCLSQSPGLEQQYFLRNTKHPVLTGGGYAKSFLCNSGFLWVVDFTDQISRYDGENITSYHIDKLSLGKLQLVDSADHQLLVQFTVAPRCLARIRFGQLQVIRSPYIVKLEYLPAPAEYGYEQMYRTSLLAYLRSATGLAQDRVVHSTFKTVDSLHNYFFYRIGRGYIVQFIEDTTAIGEARFINSSMHANRMANGLLYYHDGVISYDESGTLVAEIRIGEAGKDTKRDNFEFCGEREGNVSYCRDGTKLYRISLVKGNLKADMIYDGLENLHIARLLEDPFSGKLILGYTGLGFRILVPQVFHTTYTPDLEMPQQYYSTASYNGGLALGAETYIDRSGRLYLDMSDTVVIDLTRYAIDDTLYGIKGFSLARKEGRTWKSLFNIRKNSNRNQILKDHNGMLWVSADQYLHIGSTHRVDSTPNGAIITHLSAGPSGHVIVGTQDGAFRYSLSDGVWEHFFTPDVDVAVRDVVWLNDSTAIVATYGEGLWGWMNGSQKRLVNPVPKQLLFCSRILYNGSELVFVTTNNGLFQLNSHNVSSYLKGDDEFVGFRYFDELDGLPHREFNGGVSQAGEWVSYDLVICPSMKGMISFDPNDLRHSNISDVLFLSVIHDGEILDDKAVHRIDPDPRGLRIQVNGSNFTHSLNFRIFYRVKGSRLRYTPIDMGQNISLDHLKKGFHELEVLRVMPDGKQVVRKVIIQIRPHWYETTLAYVLWVELLIALFFLAVHLRSRQLRLRAETLQREVDRQKQELDQKNRSLEKYIDRLEESQNKIADQMIVREKLLGLISHDTMGALRSLDHLTTDLMEHQEPSLVQTISRTVKELFTSMSNTLGWVKTQKAELSVTPEEVDVRSLIERIIQSYSVHGHVSFSLHIHKGLKVSTDLQMLTSVLSNLLENQVKHGKGEVDISASRSGSNVSIGLTNSTSTIPNLAYLKAYFSKEPTSGMTTLRMSGGLGMMLIRELLEYLRGELLIEPIGDTGHHIVLTLSDLD